MKVFLLLVPLIGFVSPAIAQRDGEEVRRVDEKVRKNLKCLNVEYAVFAPNLERKTKVPMVIYLHGAGGRGDEIRKVQGQARKVWDHIVNFKKGPCLVVAPQCLNVKVDGRNGTWMPEDLNLFLKHLKETFPVDEQRIYLTGNSMGGYGSWVWGGSNPEHFAAIAPVVGGIGRGGPKDVTEDLEKWAVNLAKVPVYAFAGGKDKVVPAERSERMVAAIRKAGGTKARLRVFPEEGHGAGRLVYSSAEYYDWMFSQKRAR